MPDRVTREWTRTRADELAVQAGCWFDLRAAERVREFFARFLCHSKGQWAGKPFELLPHQWENLIAPLFGWKRPDGLRRFRRAYVEWPKKQGKSTIASGIGLFMLVGDGEQGAEVYSLGADRDQASIVHGEAIRMVEASPALQSILKINNTTRNIAFAKANSWYRSLSSEAETKEGLNAHCTISDELHAWKGEAGRRLRRAIQYAGASRRQPLDFMITTAGDDVQSVCREVHDYARGVLKGEVEDTRFLAEIRAADAGDDWTEPATWKKANPSLGVTMTEEDFAADVEEAKRQPSTISAFRRYRLNVWAQSTNPWLDARQWSQCAREVSDDDLIGLPCYAGLDLSKTRDMTALVLVWPVEWGYHCRPWFWLPEESVADVKAPDYLRTWRDQGLLQTMPGGVVDYRWVQDQIAQLHERFFIRELAYDPYNAEHLTQEITEEQGIERVLFPQTISHFTEPCKELERLIIAGEITHESNPILGWQVGHVQVRTDPNNNIRPVKPGREDPRRIDGVVALVMALARAVERSGASIYDQRGILTLGEEDANTVTTPTDWDEDEDYF